MDGDFRTNIDQIFRQIDSAEVITVFFPLVGKTLLVDTRFDMEDDPLVRVVQRAQGPEDRMRRLQRMRPQFPRPSKLAMIVWSQYSGSLDRMGVVEKLAERLAQTERKGPVDKLRHAMQQLGELERTEIVKAIRGDQYHTIWEASDKK